MKTKKENATSKESVLRKVAKSKQKISRSKAGVSLEKVVKDVKQIFKKKRAEAKAAKKQKASLAKPKPKSKKFKVRIPRNRGIIYIGHIPHGFYEKQMRDYFQQFGKVTRVRVVRSKKTGKNCGYGYVEFLHSDVAKIAAETMNNYLMSGRLLKTTYISPKKQHFGYFSGRNWSEDKYPKLKNRAKVTLSRNRFQSTENLERYVAKSLSKLSALESKLQEKGINIKFQPTDVPKT